MLLADLLKYDRIVVQMHDNPDADAVGSGFAVYKYLKEKGKNAELVYAGKNKITKSNILLLLEELEIPVSYLGEAEQTVELEEDALLLTVDCQYGEGNVEKINAKNIAMIDHHNTGRVSDEHCEIRSHLVSCSTIVYDMLLNENYNINEHIDIATALYYGLYMDSNAFSEIRHPLERDMIDYLIIDNRLLKRLMNSNFTIKELETAGIAMIRYNLDTSRRVSIIRSNPCDPNILGIIGDMLLQVDTVDVSVIYNECPGGYKISIRSCVDTVAANDLSAFLTKDIGNGGGHDDKAGGFINEDIFKQMYAGVTIENYFFDRVKAYYDSFDIIYSKKGLSDKVGFSLYEKKKITIGYVKTTDIFEEGTAIQVRTLEGDVYITASDNIYLMIGLQGEVYPIEEEVFYSKYQSLGEKYTIQCDYLPSVSNMDKNESVSLLDYANACVSIENNKIYAKPLSKCAKVFTKWEYEKYMMGDIGDYICYSYDDENDIYIINKNIFSETYESIL